VVVVAALGVGLAFYLGWIRVTSDSASGAFNITFMVNKDKFQEDEQKAVEKLHDIGHTTKE
jgi:hypothetical protein